MRFEDQFCNPDLAAHLKRLGVPLWSAFIWLNMKRGWTLFMSEAAKEYDPINPLPAFSVAELLHIFPRHDGKAGSDGITNVFLRRLGSSYTAECQGGGDLLVETHEHHEFAKRAADALAMLLIFLLESKAISVNSLTL